MWLTLLRAKPIEYYGIVHVLRDCKKCSSYKQIRECVIEKVFNYCIVGYTNVRCVAKHMYTVVM